MSNEKLVLAMAIGLIKTGDKAQGANILANLLITNPNNEVAWLWLAFCADTKERKEYCLKRALQINPNRVEVQQALKELREPTSLSNEIAVSKSKKNETVSPATTENDKPIPVQPQNEKGANSKTKLEMAIDLIQAGKKADGANILSNLLSLDPNIEDAWHWLSICAETTERKIYCLQKVLAINPKRADARQLLQELSKPEARQIRSSADFTSTRSKARLETDRTPSKTAKNQKRKDRTAEKVLTDVKIVDKSKARTKAGAKVKAKSMGKAEAKASDRTQDKTETKAKSKATAREKALAKDEAEVQAEVQARSRPDIDDEDAEKNTSSFIGANGKRIITRINIPFKDPTFIVVRSDDNMFAERNDRPHKLPIVDGDGKALFIDGVRINSFSRPKCLKVGFILDGSCCEMCDFFSSQECIFREDPFLFEDALRLAADKRDRIVQHKERQQTVIRAIYIELKSHGRPLHYTVLARIVAHHHPHLKLTEMGIFRTMSWHPETFENLGEGVFQCKQFRK